MVPIAPLAISFFFEKFAWGIISSANSLPDYRKLENVAAMPAALKKFVKY